MNNNFYSKPLQRIIVGFLALSVSACATDLQTKVSGNLRVLSKDQTLAILPVEISGPKQKEMAKLFRQGLYANLKQSNFNLLERYVVDSLLKQNNLTDPSTLLSINPMQFGEILGVDAIIFSRINKVERSYFIVHSSIELSVSIQMVDTRSGEILWRAEQTEKDFSGIGKIPTGITTAVLAPIQFVTNKFNLSRMTSNMVDKLTALIKNPSEAVEENQFEEPVIAKKATNDLRKIEELQQLKAEWQQALVLDEEPELRGYSEKPASLAKSAPSRIFQPENNLMEKNTEKTPISLKKTKRVESEMSPLPKKQRIKNPIPMNSLRAALAEPFIAVESKEGLVPQSPVNQAKHPEPLVYTVQLGAYKNKNYARKMERSLKKKGYHAFISSNAEKIYRVRVDRFDRKEDAVKLARHIESKEKLKNFVTKLN